MFSLTLLETNRKSTRTAEVPEIVVSVLVLSCRLTTTALVIEQNRAVITSRTTGRVHCSSVGCIGLRSRGPLAGPAKNIPPWKNTTYIAHAAL